MLIKNSIIRPEGQAHPKESVVEKVEMLKMSGGLEKML